MRIGFDFRLGGSINAGIGRYSFSLLTHMLELNHQDTFVVFYNTNNVDAGDLKKLESYPNVELIPTSIRHYSIAEQLILPRIINRANVDIMHFPNFNVPVFYKKPFVVTIHDMVHHKISGHKRTRVWKFYAYKYIIEKAAQHALKIITVTEWAKREIMEYLRVPVEKIGVIYEAPTPHNYESADVQGVKKKYTLVAPYFLFVGTLERKKNIPMLTKAFDLFLSKYKMNMDLVIAGKVDSHYPEVKDQALDITHRDHLVFTDFTPDRDLAALYQGAHAFVTASLHEGFGLPGVEAMQYGIPILASNTEVFNEVYDNAAIYFDPLNPEDIAGKMHLIASDAQFHEQMQEKCITRAELFDWNKTAEDTLVLYYQTLKDFTKQKKYDGA